MTLLFAFIGCSGQPSDSSFFHAPELPTTAPQKIQTLYQQCSQSNGRACYHLAEAYQHGWEGQQPNIQDAQKIFTRACDLYIAQACYAINKTTDLWFEVDDKPWLYEPDAVQNVSLSFKSVNYLPDEIFTLTSLEELSLAHTAIQVLPSHISHLTELRKIYLQKSGIRTLPTEIQALKKLHTIDASETCMIASDPMLEKLPNLKNLNISRCDVPESISHLKQLEIVNISGGGDLYDLERQLQRLSTLPKLKKLDISGRAIEVIPENIGNLTHLEHLELSSNYYETLPKSLIQLKKLKTLSIALTGKIGNTTPLLFPTEIFALSNLQKLFIFGRLKEIPLGFSSLSKLTTLSLSIRNLQTLPDDISTLTNLKHLQLTSSDIQSFPFVLLENSKLESLELSGSYGLKDDLPKILAHPAMKNIKKLGLMGLGSENLVFPAELFSNLEHLDLSYSKLKIIPQGVSTLPKLAFFNFSHNELSSIPDWMYTKKTLSRVEISHEGGIPLKDVKAIRYHPRTGKQ